MTVFTYGTSPTTFTATLNVTRYDASGAITTDTVTGRTFTAANQRIGNGGSTTADTIAMTGGGDLFAWDDYTTSTAGGTLNGSGEFYAFQNSSQRNAVETILGGAGNDVVNLTFEASGERYWEWDLANGGVNVRMYVDAGDGDDIVWGHNPGETLLGGAGNDSIDGGSGNDTLYGGNDSDRLYGNDGNDLVYGDAGTDTLSGEAGNDLVDGGAGSDAGWGEAGVDTLYGGIGDDAFYVSRDDGTGDVVSDSGGTDRLVLFGSFATSGLDWWVAGTGVTDGNGGVIGNALGGATANVSVSYAAGNVFTINLLNGVGGAVLASVTGDADEIDSVVLWNFDSPTAGQTQELFTWNGSAFTFAGYIG